MTSESNPVFMNVSTTSDNMRHSQLVRFWSIVPFHSLSLMCSMFVLYHYIGNRTSRRALHNHVIIIILLLNFFIQLTNTPWILNYYRLGYVWPQSPSFCMVWTVIDEGSHIVITHFFAWATVERHILIFHDRFVSTRRKIIIFHYAPKVILGLYCLCYYIIVIILPPCENTYDYGELVCGRPLCYYDVESVVVWDVMANDTFSTVIIIVFSIGLLLRIFGQKSRMNQRIRWRNYRKMIVQLLSISSLYMFIYVPHILIHFIELWGDREMLSTSFLLYAEFSLHYGYFLLPFVCAGSIPELKVKLRKMVSRWRRCSGTVGLQPVTISLRVVDRQSRRGALNT